MDQQDKLKKFETAVFEEIETRVTKMQLQAQELEKEELSRNEDTQLNKAYTEIQSQIQNIRIVIKRDIATFSLNEKRNILIHRNELVDNMFNSITNRIYDYIQTDDYKTRLITKLTDFSKEHQLSDVKISVGESDFANSEEIKKAYSLPCCVLQDKTIQLGGFIVRDDLSHYYFDETLETKLFEKRTDFAESSGLSLEA